MSSPLTATCFWCSQEIAADREGWRTIGRDMTVDRVRCPHGPNNRHQPEGLRSIPVQAPPREGEFRTGDLP